MATSALPSPAGTAAISADAAASAFAPRPPTSSKTCGTPRSRSAAASKATWSRRSVRTTGERPSATAAAASARRSELRASSAQSSVHIAAHDGERSPRAAAAARSSSEGA